LEPGRPIHRFGSFGNGIFYARTDGAGKPVVLLEGPWLPTPLSLPNYDVSSDGQHFLMLKAADEDQGARQIVVVQNWFEELKRRMAAGKK
jgi:hypothetical protein